MIMSFCRKSVHYSFLVLTTSIDTTTSTATNTDKLPFGCQPYHHGQYHISSSLTGGGLGLISAMDGDIQRLPNVIESPSTIKSTPPSSPDYIFTTPPRKDPGGMGFIDDMGGGVDGLMSCTESLGFESSDERLFDDKFEEAMLDQNDGNRDRFQRSTTKKMKWKKEGGREVKKFPPPLSSLRPNGQRNFFLRAVRKDGRLELTEVRIERTEILRASREDGRLRLHLIRDDDIQDSVEEEEEEEDVVDEEIEREQDKEEKEKENAVLVEKEEEQAEEKKIGDVEEVLLRQKVNGDAEGDGEKESAVEEWAFPVSGEGFRWCHELMTHHDHHHHHHNLHVWRQHCVTTG